MKRKQTARPGSICVFCGSSPGRNPQAGLLARSLGAAVARAGCRLVYGGGSVGLMGVVADAALGAGGKVTGIIPACLRSDEIVHTGLDELVVVDDMFERKRLMMERSEAFAILPGGLGTIDEALDVIGLLHLGQHARRPVLIDMNGYWQPFVALLDHLAAAGFAPAGVHGYYRLAADVETAAAALGIAGGTGSVGQDRHRNSVAAATRRLGLPDQRR